MQSTLLEVAHRLSDDELLRQLRALAARERDATVDLVAHLAELDLRRLHLALGFGSLFSYCTQTLRLAEHAAYNRIEAARASRKFPVILDQLADGSLNISSVRLLAPHLTSANHARVLQLAAGKSKREVEQLVARLAPRPDAPTSIRRVSSRTWPGDSSSSAGTRSLGGTEAGASASASASVNAGATATEAGTGPEDATAGGARTVVESASVVDGAPHSAEATAALVRGQASATSASGAASSADRPVVAPLSAERYRVQFTVGRGTYDALRQLQDLLRREIPDGDPGRIFDRALKLLLQDVARRKAATTSTAIALRSRQGRAAATRSRHVPAQVRRTVWLRDGGRCAFVSRGGRRCGERAFLEFHHVEPYAIGGETSAANLSLRCRAHNVHEHVRLFGPMQEAPLHQPPTRPGAS